jgi:spore maturation protein CgeB
MRVVLIGLSITSSWGNGHATNYRALVRELVRRGHHVRFLERDVPWYAAHRDLPDDLGGAVQLYDSTDDLERRCCDAVCAADLVVVGSYVPEGARVAAWALARSSGVTAFYDLDTPVTLAQLDRGVCEYLTRELVPGFDLYLSFTGGPTLDRLADELHARRPLAFHCFVDPGEHRPAPARIRWQLGYLGTFSEDRQPGLDRLLLEPARRTPEHRHVVAGPRYPAAIRWPANVDRIEHLGPSGHAGFYASQRFTLSVTRADMRRAGYSPSVRLFEAAACGVPVITDPWPGLETLFDAGGELLVADSADEVLELLFDLDEAERLRIAERARARVLAEHTAAARCDTLLAEVSALLPEHRAGAAAR